MYSCRPKGVSWRSGRIAPRRLHLDDLGTQLGQLRGTPVANRHAGGTIQHPKAGKRFRFFEIVFLAHD